MKKIILILSISIALISCAKDNKYNLLSLFAPSTENKMETAIKDYIDKNSDDPKSYESVELKVLDTITIGQVAKEIVVDINTKNKEVEDRLRHLNKFHETDNGFNGFFINMNKGLIKNCKLQIKRLNEQDIKYKTFLNSKEALYSVSHKYRLKNPFGALYLKNSYFIFDKDFHIIEVLDKDSSPEDFAKEYYYENYFKKDGLSPLRSDHDFGVLLDCN